MPTGTLNSNVFPTILKMHFEARFDKLCLDSP